MRLIVVLLLCTLTWFNAPLKGEDDHALLQPGERFAVATFTDGVIQLTVQADGSLAQDNLLPPEAVGSVAVLDALPDGKLAMAGFVTQLLLWDEGAETITALTNFPERGTNWYHIDLTADASLGAFQTAFDPKRGRLFTLDFTGDEPVWQPIESGAQPAFSAAGEWLALVVDPPLDTVTMVDVPARIEVSTYPDGDVIFSDDRGCTSPRFHPSALILAYVCQPDDGETVLVWVDLDAETVVEHPVAVRQCLSWSPDGSRLLLSGYDARALTYVVIDAETGESQTLDLPEALPDYDPLACWAWLSDPPEEAP